MEALIGLTIGGQVYNASLKQVFEQYERGEISDETLIWRFQQFNPTLDPRLFVEAWNSMLVGMRPTVLTMLTSLRRDYNLSLLSNINGFHARHIRRYLKTEHNVPDFLTRYFDQYFYSHEIGMRKPEMRIYSTVSQQLGITDLASVLFIDDNQENIEAAQLHGWSVRHHNPKNHITEVIRGYLV